MKWKNLKLGKKFTVGFGSILIMLTIVGLWSIQGIGGIVGNAGQVIEGNKLKADFVQKTVDHLEWVNQVNALLSDDSVHELHVQTDPHQCAFGKWYYGEERAHAEELVPSLEKILADIEKPHNELHNSAVAINENYVNVDQSLGGFLREKKTDHLSWTHKVKDAFLHHHDKVEVQMDPTKCSLGLWMYSEETQNLMKTDPEFAAALHALETPHNELHKSAVTINGLLAQNKEQEAIQVYQQVTEPAATQCLNKIDAIIAWHDAKLAGLEKAKDIYSKQTTPALAQVKTLLNELRTEITDNIMTDEQMLTAASNTRWAVVSISIFALLAGVVLAYIIARGILKPLRKGVDFAQVVSSGDFSQAMDIDQQDEIGELANALNQMSGNLRNVIESIQQSAEQVAASSEELSASSQSLSNAATEQAASLEETSASIEELTSSVQQNANNARKTEDIANTCASSIEEMSNTTLDANKLCDNTVTLAQQGGDAVRSMVEAMGNISSSSKKIADIIKVIDDIADQTNLLALNAAIEAARAGDMGKGFAVVAVEVRKLAERSQQAAKEISNMIIDSVQKVEEGANLANQCGESLEKIVSGISQVSDTVRNVTVSSKEQVTKIHETARLVQEIAAACVEQSEGSSQIVNAIGQLDSVTQQNTSTSEEISSSSEELASQAQMLQEMVNQFVIEESARERRESAHPSSPRSNGASGKSWNDYKDAVPKRKELAQASKENWNDSTDMRSKNRFSANRYQNEKDKVEFKEF